MGIVLILFLSSLGERKVLTHVALSSFSAFSGTMSYKPLYVSH